MDFEMEDIVAVGMAIVESIVVLIMMKYSGASTFYKLLAAGVSMVAGYFVTKFIISR